MGKSYEIKVFVNDSGTNSQFLFFSFLKFPISQIPNFLFSCFLNFLRALSLALSALPQAAAFSVQL